MPKQTILTRKVDVRRLERLLKREAHRRIRERLQAILWISTGVLAQEVAKKIGRCRQSVAGFVRLFNGQGLQGLLTIGRGPGRQPCLSLEKKRQILSWIQKGPRALGLPFNLWDCKRLSHEIKKQWAVSLTDERVRQILHELGATLLRPKHKLPSVSPSLRRKKNGTSKPFWRWPDGSRGA